MQIVPAVNNLYKHGFVISRFHWLYLHWTENTEREMNLRKMHVGVRVAWVTSRQEVMSNRQLPLFACPSQPTQEFHKYQIINAFSICQRSGQHIIKGDPQTWVWFSFLMSLVLPTQLVQSRPVICLDLLRIPHWLSVNLVEECVCAVRDNYRLWEQSVFSSPPPSPPPAPAPPGKQSISSPTSSTSIPLTQGGPTPPSNSAMVGRCPIFHAYHRTSSFTLYSSPSTLNFERLTLELEAALQRGPHHPANETQAQEFSSRLQYCFNVWYDFAASNISQKPVQRQCNGEQIVRSTLRGSSVGVSQVFCSRTFPAFFADTWWHIAWIASSWLVQGRCRC